jgi:transposase-like protein
MNDIKQAIPVFKDYYACPECSHGKNVVNEAAVYHVSALTHRSYECKDCRQTFAVPSSVKINSPKPFHAGKKPEYKPRSN